MGEFCFSLFVVALLFISDLNSWHVAAGVSNLCKHASAFQLYPQAFLPTLLPALSLTFIVELLPLSPIPKFDFERPPFPSCHLILHYHSALWPERVSACLSEARCCAP